MRSSLLASSAELSVARVNLSKWLERRKDAPKIDILIPILRVGKGVGKDVENAPISFICNAHESLGATNRIAVSGPENGELPVDGIRLPPPDPEQKGSQVCHFGRHILAVIACATRVRAALNEPDPTTFYGGGAAGYTSYPALS